MNKKHLYILAGAAVVGYFFATTINAQNIVGLKQVHYAGRNLGLGNGFSFNAV